MWIVNLILTILLLIFFLYMFVRIKKYVDDVTNALEDYINDIKDITADTFKKLGNKLGGGGKGTHMQTVLFSQKEIEVIKACFYMALKEGLYYFGRIGIDASEEDIKGILSKFGMSEPEIVKFMEDTD